MAYKKNITILPENILSLSGSTIALTGSVFGNSISGNVGLFSSLSASSLKVNDYTLPSGDGGTGQVISTNGAGQLTFIDVNTNPGGPDTAVQFNSGSELSGSSDLTYDYNTGVLSGTLASFHQISASYIDLSYPTDIDQHEPGRLYFDDSNYSLKLHTEISSSDGGITEISLGQQLAVKVKNVSGVTLSKGKIVHITGSTSNSDTPNVTTASWESDENCADTLGMVMDSIANNETGYVLQNGLLKNIDTNSFSIGDMIYLSSSGDYTNQLVVSPNHEVRIGQVIRAGNNGTIFVRIQNGYEIDELHDVLISSKTNGDILSWDNNSLVWKNTKTLSGSYTILQDITASNGQFTEIVADKVTAREYHTELVSASVIYQSGSTKFGDTPGGAEEDAHQFSGSLYITGSTVTLTGGSFSGNGSGLTNLAAGQLEGTIPSTVLGNSSLYVGTTQVALNRASSTQTLTGVSIDGNAATSTKVNTTFDNANQVKYVPFVNTNGNQGLLIDSGLTYVPFSDTLYVGNLVETSTREIKENIKSIPGQLRNIKKLNPVRYNKIDSKREEIGLIAEEVGEIYPEFVHERGINYPKMVSVLVSAVQELTSKVEKQQKEITFLKKKIK